MVTHTSEDALQALPRPAHPRQARRSTSTPMPAAWAVLLHERCGCPRSLTWNSWQSLASSRWSEAMALRQQFVLFLRCPETPADLARHGVTPARLIEVFEALRLEGLLSPGEAVRLEEAVLISTTHTGTWKEASHGHVDSPTPRQSARQRHWPPRT